jgi:hypothetical protein
VTVCPESFFTTLKREEVYLHDYRTLEEAEANLSRFIEDVYKGHQHPERADGDRRGG